MQNAVAFVVVGPSGAGKDTVLNAALAQLEPDVRPLLVPRVITRPATEDAEQHIPVTEDGFETAFKRGIFAIHWRANGLSYGIEKQALLPLEKGKSLVINGSRAALTDFRSLFQPISIVLITAKPELIAERLQKRGRESANEVQHRIERSSAYQVTGKDVTVIENNGAVEDAANKLAALFLKHQKQVPSPISA